MEKKYLSGEDYLKLENELRKIGFDQIKAVDLIAGRFLLDIDQTICHLPYCEIIHGNRIEATIKLERISFNDDYKVTGYQMDLQKSDVTHNISHYFDLSNHKPNQDNRNKITKIEGYNLMDGRAVLKSAGESETWLIMDFSRKNDSLKLGEIQSMTWADYKSLIPENHVIIEKPGSHLNLDVAIMNYHLREVLIGSDKKKLIAGMCIGNRETATQICGKNIERKVTMEAEPRFGIIKLFDEYGRRIKIIAPAIREKIDQGCRQKTGKMHKAVN